MEATDWARMLEPHHVDDLVNIIDHLVATCNKHGIHEPLDSEDRHKLANLAQIRKHYAEFVKLGEDQ